MAVQTAVLLSKNWSMFFFWMKTFQHLSIESVSNGDARGIKKTPRLSLLVLGLVTLQAVC